MDLSVGSHLSDLFYDTKHSVALSAPLKLSKASGLSISTVKNWLSSQDAYTLNRNVKRKFPRMTTLSHGIDDRWQGDLMDVSKYARQNKGVKFILVCIDIFSRFAFAEPLKSKGATDVASAFEKIFLRSGRYPHFSLTTDQGKEFRNHQVKRVLESNCVKYHYVTTTDEIKCAVVERLIRTLREKIAKLQTYRGNMKYIDKLRDIVNGYNRTPHRTIGCSPEEVINGGPEVYQEVYMRLFGPKPHQKPWKPPLNIGDHVRITKHLGPFHKGTGRKFIKEIFVIKERNFIRGTKRPVYKLTDMKGEDITSVFYPEELTRVTQFL